MTSNTNKPDEKRAEITNTDRACQVMHEIDFTTEKDMYSAIARVELLFDGFDSDIQSLQSQLHAKSEECERLREQLQGYCNHVHQESTTNGRICSTCGKYLTL